MEAPRYLEENGVFQMICEWVEVEGEPWEQRLQSWTAGSGCDVFVYVGPLAIRSAMRKIGFMKRAACTAATGRMRCPIA